MRDHESAESAILSACDMQQASKLSKEPAAAFFATPSSSAKMGELHRVQLAHEGMRMLLCSELKQAEDLFKASR